MKKILILTLSTGGGHNEVASNLKNELIRNNFEINIIDVLCTINKIADNIILKSFNMVTDKFPNLYGKLYYLSDKEGSNKILSDSLTKIYSEKLKEIINDENPDLIISTHPLFINIIGYLKSKKIINIPFIYAITDIEAHWTCVNSFVDAYIVANKFTVKSLIAKGASKNKIFPYGIPIKEKFYSYQKKPSYNGEKLRLLLMSGSLGMTEIHNVIDNIIDFEDIEHINLVCGKNEKLKESIQERFKNEIENGSLNIYGFTDKIPELMNDSHILITKPGGITISEAMAICIPMIIPFYIPGQEELNLNYLTNQNFAIFSPKIHNLKDILYEIINNPNILNIMIENMLILKKVNYNGIVQLCQNLIENNMFL